MFNLFGQKKSLDEFKFKENEKTACFVCEHVLNKTRPILFVSHDLEDSSWQFLCGKDDHSEQSAKIISLKEATELDPSINELYEMPIGVGVERKDIKSKWIPFRL